MNEISSPSRVLQAINALKSLDRRGAAILLKDELAAGAEFGERWRSVAKLAGTVGEIDIEDRSHAPLCADRANDAGARS
ncbi:MAG: hypothetical protein WDN06_07150 [Asticcacaulis sp.]